MYLRPKYAFNKYTAYALTLHICIYIDPYKPLLCDCLPQIFGLYTEPVVYAKYAKYEKYAKYAKYAKHEKYAKYAKHEKYAKLTALLVKFINCDV